MNVLFVNHTSAASGAEFALMRLVEGLGHEHRVAVACPPQGPLAELVDDAGVPRHAVPAFEASLRLDPVQTPVGIARLLAGGAALARVIRRVRPDVVHANTPRAGLMGAIALRLGGPPLVVRAHEHLELSPAGRATRFVLARSASAVLAVSQDTAAQLNDGLRRPLATHVYNPFDGARFDPERMAPAPVREELGIGKEVALLGHVAQITPWKGQDTSIRALADLRRGGLDAHLLLVGGIAFAGRTVRYDNHGFERELHRLVGALAAERAVHFLGPRADVPEILGALDLSLLPSWSEPFGLAALESMAMGTPPLVSEVGGGPELVEDGVSGRVLPPRLPARWAAAARELLADREALAHMGAQARVAATRFSDERHTADVLAVYERVLGPTASALSVRASHPAR